MALCTECDARIEYQGNGSQRDYTFPFEYDDVSEVKVSIYDEDKTEYVKTNNKTNNHARRTWSPDT